MSAAIFADLSKVAPSTTKQKDGTKSTKFSKNEFEYDAESNSDWCPAGKQMAYLNTTSHVENGRQRIKFRYRAEQCDCAGFPLASRCISRTAKQRRISHKQHEAKRIAHGDKMNNVEAMQKYSRRRHAGERPLAMIKGHFGARRFLTRGLDRVRNEWLWLTSSFNLHRLLRLLARGPAPPQEATAP